MADINNKSIDELQSASAIANADLLVLQQNGVAKSVSGSVVKSFVGQKVVEELPDAVSSLGYDYVVDQGTSGDWRYRKWNSGIAECWCMTAFSAVSITNAWGSLYESTSSKTLTFPSGLFNSVDSCILSPGGGGGEAMLEIGDGLSTTKTQRFWFVRGTSATINVRVNCHAFGRWK